MVQFWLRTWQPFPLPSVSGVSLGVIWSASLGAPIPVILHLSGPSGFKDSGLICHFHLSLGMARAFSFPVSFFLLVYTWCTDWVLVLLAFYPLVGLGEIAHQRWESLGRWSRFSCWLVDAGGQQPVDGLASGPFYPSLYLVIKQLVGSLDQVRGRKFMPNVRDTLGNEIWPQNCSPLRWLRVSVRHSLRCSGNAEGFSVGSWLISFI